MDFCFNNFVLLVVSKPNFISPALALNIRTDTLYARNQTQLNSRKIHVKHIIDVGLKEKLTQMFVFWRKKNVKKKLIIHCVYCVYKLIGIVTTFKRITWNLLVSTTRCSNLYETEYTRNVKVF